MDHNIDVVIRVRPLIKREAGSECLWSTHDNCIKCKEKSFFFDKVFGQNTYNIDIYNEVGKQLVENVMQGINGTLFAYGQTASGKTHTIIGEPTELGIVPLAIKDIFTHIDESPQREFLLRASYMEIYNEEIKDLLNDNPKSDPVRVRNNVDNEIVIDNLTEHTITSYENVMQLLENGIRNRKTGATNLNERSSRSHCIFQLVIESRAISDDANISVSTDDGAVIVSQLNLVDLAGSERAAQTGTQGIRFKESNFINTSLLTLGLVIRKLSENDRNVHIPYRDSKLTRILQHSLGGNAKTAIIATVSPVVFDETTQTLMFAERAKNVKNKPKVNEVLDGDTMLRRQRREISDLKKKIAELESGASIVHHTDMTKQKSRMASLLKQIICASSRKKEPSTAHNRYNRRQTCCPSDFRSREQQLKMSITIDEEDIDDTTCNFEKLEYKLLQEEMELEKEREAKASTSRKRSAPGKVTEMKSTLSEKEQEIEGLLEIIKDLQSKNSEIPTLRSTVESLETENNLLQSSFDKNVEKYMALSREIDAKNDEINQLNRERAQHDQEMGEESFNDKEKSMAQILDKVKAIKDFLDDNETEDLLSGIIEETGKSELFVSRSSFKKLEGDISTLNDALNSLGEENQFLQDTVDKKDKALGDFELENKELLTKYEEFESKNESAIAELKLKIQSKDDELFSKEQSISDLSNSCEEKVVELLELKNKLEKLRLIAANSGDVATLKENLLSLSNENENLMSTIEKQNLEIKGLKSNEEDFVRRLELVESERNQKQTEVEQLLQESSQFVVDKETVLNELSIVKQERDSYKEQFETQQIDMNKNSLKINDLESSISQLNHQLEAKDGVLVEKVQYISNMLAKDKEKDAELVERNKELCDLRTKLETAGSLDADVGTLKDVIETLGEENQHLQNCLDQKTIENNSLITEKSNHQEEINQTREKNDALVNELTQHLTEKEELLKQLEDQKNTMESHLNELKTAQTSEREEVMQLNLLISHLQTDKENLLKELDERKNVMEVHLNELKNSQTSEIDEVKRLNSLILDLQTDKENLVKQLNDQRDTMELHLDELKNARTSESEEVRRMNTLVSELQTEKENLLKQLDEQKNIIESQLDEPKDEQTSENEVMRLNSLVSELREEVSDYESVLEAKEKQVEEMSLQLENWCAHIQALESDDVEAHRDALQEEVDTLQVNLKEKEKHVLELQLQLDNVKKEEPEKTDLDEVRDEKMETTEELVSSDVQEQLNFQQNLLNEKESVVIELQQQIDMLKKKLESTEAESRTSEKDAEVSELQEHLQSQMQLLNDKEKLRSELQQQVEMMQRELESKNADEIEIISLMNEKEIVINELRQQIVLLQKTLDSKDDLIVEDISESTKANSDIQEQLNCQLELLKEKDDYIVKLQQQIELLEKNSSLISVEVMTKDTSVVNTTMNVVDDSMLVDTSIGREASAIEETCMAEDTSIAETGGSTSVCADLAQSFASDLHEQLSCQMNLLNEKESLISELQQKIDELERNLDLKTKECDIIKESSILESADPDDPSILHTMNEENTELKINIERQLSELNELRGRNELLNHQFDALKSDRDSKADQIEQLLSESSQFVLEKEKLLHDLTNVTVDRDHLKERIVALSSELNEGRVRINELEVMIDELKDVAKRVKEMSEEPEKYEEILRNVSKDCSGIEIDADEFLSEKDKSSTVQKQDSEVEDGASLQSELILVENEHNKDAIEELKIQVQTLSEEKENLQNQLEIVSTERASLISSFEQKSDNTTEDLLVQAKQEVEDQKKLVELHLDEKCKLSESLREKSEECSHLQSQLENNTNEFLSLKYQFEEATNRCEVLLEESTCRKDELEEFTKRVEKLVNTNKDLKDNLERKNEEFKILTQVEEQLKSNLELLEKERENNISKINELDEIITQEKTSNERLCSEKEALQTNIDLLGDELNFQKDEYTELEVKNKDLKIELDLNKDNLEQKISDLRVSESNIDQLNIEIKELNLKIDEKNIDIVNLNQKHDEAEETILVKSDEIKVLKESINSRDEDIKVFKGRINEDEILVNKLNSKLKEYKEKIVSLSEDLKEVKKPCGNTDIKDWNMKVVDLEKMNFDLKERQQEMQSECNKLKQKSYELNCCNESLETSNQTLLSENKTLKDSLQREKDSTNSKLQKLKDHLKAKYEKSYNNLKEGHVRIEQGLETAYEKYKYYKKLYYERDAECERYRVMLEEVSVVAQKIKSKGNETAEKKEPHPNVSPEGPGKSTVPRAVSPLEVKREETLKRKMQDVDENEFLKKAQAKKSDEGCQQQ